MNVLLDTHTLLRLLSTPTKIEASTLALLSEQDVTLWVSAASAWEIATKTRLGRLDGRLPWTHRDPFDRILVAQALRRTLTLATRDSSMLAAALTPTLRV